MLKFFNANNPKSLNKLQLILNSRKLRQQNRTSNVKESNKESTEGNKPKTGVEDPKWRRHWSLVFRKMK